MNLLRLHDKRVRLRDEKKIRRAVKFTPHGTYGQHMVAYLKRRGIRAWLVNYARKKTLSYKPRALYTSRLLNHVLHKGPVALAYFVKWKPNEYICYGHWTTLTEGYNGRAWMINSAIRPKKQIMTTDKLRRLLRKSRWYPEVIYTVAKKEK